MDTQAPAKETSQGAAEKVDSVAESNRQIALHLNNAHYLLNACQHSGKDAELVVITKQFLIDLKKHIESAAPASK